MAFKDDFANIMAIKTLEYIEPKKNFTLSLEFELRSPKHYYSYDFIYGFSFDTKMFKILFNSHEDNEDDGQCDIEIVKRSDVIYIMEINSEWGEVYYIINIKKQKIELLKRSFNDRDNDSITITTSFKESDIYE